MSGPSGRVVSNGGGNWGGELRTELAVALVDAGHGVATALQRSERVVLVPLDVRRSRQTGQ